MRANVCANVRTRTYDRLIPSYARSTREKTPMPDAGHQRERSCCCCCCCRRSRTATNGDGLRIERARDARERTGSEGQRESRGGRRGGRGGGGGRKGGGRVRESTMREERRREARAKRTGVGCAHEGRLKGEKEEDGIKRGKKRMVSESEVEGMTTRERKRRAAHGDEGERSMSREQERERETS